MRTTLVIKVVLALAFGALLGLLPNVDYERWSRLGREAFLAHEADRFAMYMAHPHVNAVSIVLAAIFAVGLAAVYEGLAFLGGKLVALSPKRISEAAKADH